MTLSKSGVPNSENYKSLNLNWYKLLNKLVKFRSNQFYIFKEMFIFI